MKRNVVAITAGMLIFGLALTGCSSSEPTSQNTPESTASPTPTAEPTETPTGSFQGKCLDIAIEYSLLSETLVDYSKEKEWPAAAKRTATFFGSDFNAIVVGDDPYESELVKGARGALGGLQYRLKEPYSAGSVELAPFLDLVYENYMEFKDVCTIETGEEVWW